MLHATFVIYQQGTGDGISSSVRDERKVNLAKKGGLALTVYNTTTLDYNFPQSVYI